MPRALLSVSDKRGIADAARRLAAMGYEILSTGGTYKTITDAGIAAREVSDVTGFPECFGGRVKTMHPLIMGGILMRDGDEGDASALGIEPITVVIVNLYPFAETIKKYQGPRTKDQTSAAIEQIDIGGPTLLRSAAKNHARVTAVSDPDDYDRVLTALERDGKTSDDLRAELSGKVFAHTAAYDGMIADYLSDAAHPQTTLLLTDGMTLRYGENPHQKAMYYSLASEGNDSWGMLHQGKALSYLNILDGDAAWSAVQEFSEPTAVLVKHANPSGIASRASIDDAFQAAYDADRLSAFGVIIALNRSCTETIAKKILDQKIFVEVVVAPGYEDGALALFTQKPNIRIITQRNGERRAQTLYRSVQDGMLVQEPDLHIVTEKDLTCVTEKKPTDAQIADLLFAWKAVKYAKSNAIVLAKDRVTIGIGSGQTSRVDSTWIALKRAGERAKGSVLASDAFFPFPDSIDEAAKGGIAAIIQPGGSVRDADVFKRANELGISMVTTGVRAFRH